LRAPETFADALGRDLTNEPDQGWLRG
jgi:hypothetical protein